MDREDDCLMPWSAVGPTQPHDDGVCRVHPADGVYLELSTRQDVDRQGIVVEKGWQALALHAENLSVYLPGYRPTVVS
jgi:hypothetical protein